MFSGIDPPREVPGAAETILRQLEHYGLHWDGDVLWQSQRHHAYREALAWLHEQGLSYYCTCTRARIQSIGGIYDGHCRVLHHGPDNAAVRIRQQHPVTQFTDQLRGIIHADEKLAREVITAPVRVRVFKALAVFTTVIAGCCIMDQTMPQCVSASSIRSRNLLTSCAALFTPTKNWHGKILSFIAVMGCSPTTWLLWLMIISRALQK